MFIEQAGELAPESVLLTYVVRAAAEARSFGDGPHYAFEAYNQRSPTSPNHICRAEKPTS